MSSANCDSFTYSFPIWIPFFLFLVWFLWLGVPTLCWIQVERGDTFVLFLILEELSAFQHLNFMYLFGFGCSGSSVLKVGFLAVSRATLQLQHTWACHCGGFSRCRALGAQASVVAAWAQLLLAYGIFLDQDQTYIPCLGGQILSPLDHQRSPSFSLFSMVLSYRLVDITFMILEVSPSISPFRRVFNHKFKSWIYEFN